MTKEEISKLVLTNPDEAWKKIQSDEIDISHIDFNVLKKKVENTFLTAAQIEAVESVFWATYLVEKDAANMISSIEKQLGNTDIVDSLLNRLTFGDKISLVKERYNKSGLINPFVNFAWKVKTLRDAVAHQRFEELKYDGLDLSDKKSQFKFLIDLTTAFSKSAQNIKDSLKG
jgi:hypothetical protein